MAGYEMCCQCVVLVRVGACRCTIFGIVMQKATLYVMIMTF